MALPELCGVGPSGRPIFQVSDRVSGRVHKYNSHVVGGFYRKGLLARAARLASSYSLDLVEFGDGDLIVDCGANVGDLYLWVDLVQQASVTYIGVEPGVDEFFCLTQNATGTNTTLVQAALADVDSRAAFYYDPHGANSALLPSPDTSESYTVDVYRLDSLMKSLALDESRIRVLKIEAEGTEPEVVAGIGLLATSIDYISADLGPERGIHQESTVAQVTDLLYDMGFRMASARGHRYLYAQSKLAMGT